MLSVVGFLFAGRLRAVDKGGFGRLTALFPSSISLVFLELPSCIDKIHINILNKSFNKIKKNLVLNVVYVTNLQLMTKMEKVP